MSDLTPEQHAERIKALTTHFSNESYMHEPLVCPGCESDTHVDALLSLLGEAERERDAFAAERRRLSDLHLSRTKTTHADLTELIGRAEAAEQRAAALEAALAHHKATCANHPCYLCDVLAAASAAPREEST